MFHLFNKVYVSFDFNLEPGNRIVISDLFSGIPFAPEDQQQFMSDTYADLVDEHFGAGENSLWAFLYNIPATEKFVIYVKSDEFMPLVLKYFRALLPNATDTALYTIYYLSVLRYHQIISQLNYFGPATSELFANIDLLPKATFIKLAKKVSKIEPFSDDVKQNVGIEYLLASYLVDEDTPFDDEFERRVEAIVWKSIVGEMVSFKQNWLNGFFNIDELLDDVKTLKFDSATFDDVLKTRPELSYLMDINIDHHDPEYIKENCDFDKIFELEELYQKSIGGCDDQVIATFRKFAKSTDENRVRELIEYDIDLKFGTQLFGRGDNRLKMNPYLVSFFYQLSRTNKAKDLKKYKM